MRNAAIRTITDLADQDKDIILLTGDLGFGVLDEFRERYPKQFFNVGICEQSMASIAAGLAVEGKKVYLYSIGNFPTLRCIEQIRNDICYHNASVTILAVGGGFAYGSLGMSHHATEDIAMMRSLPNMKVFTPADTLEAEVIVRTAYLTDSPCYIRLNKGGEAPIHTAYPEQYTIGKEFLIQSGEDVCIFASGAIIEEAVKATKILATQGISTEMYSFCSIKPIASELILACAEKFGRIITLEEHNIIGGLGSAVSEVIASKGLPAQVIRLGLNDAYTSIVGSQKFLRQYYGLDAEAIIHIVTKTGSVSDV